MYLDLCIIERKACKISGQISNKFILQIDQLAQRNGFYCPEIKKIEKGVRLRWKEDKGYVTVTIFENSPILYFLIGNDKGYSEWDAEKDLITIKQLFLEFRLQINSGIIPLGFEKNARVQDWGCSEQRC